MFNAPVPTDEYQFALALNWIEGNDGYDDFNDDILT